MRATVDVSSLVVRYGESSWPFQFDLGQGLASIALDSCVYQVYPLTWRAKMRLARFAYLGEAFIQARFLEASLRAPKISPSGERNEAVLVALAIWLNRASEQAPGLPLDQGRLAGVTAELCRSLGVGPMTFAELTAAEVEMLWQNLDREFNHDTGEDESSGIPVRTRPPRTTASSNTSEQQFNTKIVIVPDDTPESVVALQNDSQKTALRSQHESENHSSPRLAASEDSEELAASEESEEGEESGASVARIEQVTEETKPPVLPKGRLAAGAEHNTAARFRVSVDKPIAKASMKATATLRLPMSQPGRSPQSQAVRRAQVASALMATESTDDSKASASTETSSDLEISEMLFSRSPVQGLARPLVRSLVQPVVQPDLAVAPSAIPRWPEFEETVERKSEVSPSNETSSGLGISEMLFSPSQVRPLARPLLRPPVQPVVEPGLAASPSATPRWPEFEKTTEMESFPRAEAMECVLDEFCERLAEAAADLGIMEEV